MIIELLKQNPKSLQELAFCLSRSQRVAHLHLTNLENINIVKRIKGKYSRSGRAPDMWFIDGKIDR